MLASSKQHVTRTMVVIVMMTLFLSLAPYASGLFGRSKVILLQESFIPDTSSYARWLGNATSAFTDVTICYRVRIFYYRPEVVVFSYINTKGDKIRMDHNRVGMQVMVTAAGLRLITDLVTPLMQWSAFCFSLSIEDPASIYFNGNKVKYVRSSSEVTLGGASENPVLLDMDGIIVLGQDQDAPAAVYDASESLCGAVTDLNVWSHRLSEEEMAAISGCNSRGHGDVLDWDASQFEIGEFCSVMEMNLSKTCNVVPQPYYMFPNLMSFASATVLCKAFGGELAAPRDEEDQQVVYSLARESSAKCSKEGEPLTWLGIVREGKHQPWRYYSTGENVTYFNWAFGQPDVEGEESCAVLKGKTFKGAWGDQSCGKSYKFCVLCSLKTPILLRLRGICDSSVYDNRFVMTGTKNGKPYFRGYFRSHIYYTANGSWRLENIQVTRIYAQMNNDGSLDFPIGRHDWEFSHGFCRKAMMAEHTLTLSQCTQNEEFTCDDGTCIPMDQVCDRRIQCRDRSDEVDCSTVELPQGYQSTLPPPGVTLNDSLPVYLNVTLRTFIKIDAINNKFTAEMLIRILWKDERIRFKHLRYDRQLNIILPSEMEEMWVPTIDFLNAESNEETRVDSASKITIERLGSPLLDNIENPKEARIYEGRENYIRNTRKYTIVFLCNFNFFYYPFNTDYCSMIFRVKKNTDNYVTLEKYGAGTIYVGTDNLPEFTIGGIKTRRYITNEPYSGLETIIQLRHLYTTQVVTVFIPTTLIIIISFATFSFKWFDFQNRIMVSLTALLVLSTLFSQVSNSLPKTSYFKLVDVWFFSSILFAFLTIMTHTLVEYKHKYNANVDPNPKTSVSNFIPIKVAPTSVSDKELKRRLNDEHFKARWGKTLPELINMGGYTITLSAYTIFFVVFWIVAFSQKINEDAKNFTREFNAVTGYPE